MSKKRFLLQIINTFEQNTEEISVDLHKTFAQIRENLDALSEEEVELQTTSVVSLPDAEQYDQHSEEWLSALLYQALSQMEKSLQQTQGNKLELTQAYNMLRGELGMDIDPPSPE